MYRGSKTNKQTNTHERNTLIGLKAYLCIVVVFVENSGLYGVLFIVNSGLKGVQFIVNSGL